MKVPKLPKMPKMPKIKDYDRLYLFFADGSEYCQQFAAFFILSIHLLSSFPTNFYNYFKPRLSISGLS